MAIDEKSIREALGLDEGADVLEAIRTMKEKAEQPAPTTGGDGDDVSKLRADLTAAQQQLVELTGDRARRDAEAVVDIAIKEGRALPAQRDHLLKMAQTDLEGAKAFIQTLPKNGLIQFGERGTSKDGAIDYADLEPTESEIAVAKSVHGRYDADVRVALMREKASRQGVELPADFGKEKAAASA